MERNLTTGNVAKTLAAFSLPYLLSYFLQTFYGLADLFIIGQFSGVASTTAVSIGSQFMHMVTVIIEGLALGSTVIISQAVGANKKDEMNRAIGNTIVQFLIFSFGLMAVLLLFIHPIVSVLNTPAEAVSGLTNYLTVCFIGIPFITAYNMISAIFRGMGDSTSPMYFVAVACVVNIGLDYLLIGYFGLGPIGAALGTTLSQSVSVIIAVVVIMRKHWIQLGRSDFHPRYAVIRRLLSVGLPSAIQNGLVQISFLVITMIVNKRGLTDAAAVGVVEKIIGVMFLVPTSMRASVSALCAQNVGSELYDRARQVLYDSLIFTVGLGLIFSITTLFDANFLVGLFVKDPNVIFAGAQYLKGYVWDCVFAGIQFCFSGYFCAYGRSILSFLHNFIAIVVARIPLAYLASNLFPDTLFPLGLTTAMGSTVSIVICLFIFRWMNRQEKAGKIVTK